MQNKKNYAKPPLQNNDFSCFCRPSNISSQTVLDRDDAIESHLNDVTQIFRL